MTSGKRDHMNSVMLPGYASIRELKDQKNKIALKLSQPGYSGRQAPIDAT